jgi:Flp pilus assembly protein TadD
MMCVAASGAAGQTASPAERSIAAAQKAIAARPSRHDAYNELALALARRARETADTTYYDRAEEAIRTSLELSPNNFEAQKMRAWVLLGRHEFGQALELARALNTQVPDDLVVYGFLTDAYAELGNYEEAEKACQWMLDLRPGNIPAFTRAAYLRELFGDVEGAVELMRAAYQRMPPDEVEDRAWVLTQLAHLALVAGRIGDAEQILTEAVKLVPDYHYALANLARVRSAQGRYAHAAALLKQRYEGASHPENLFALAEALERAGRTAEAKAAYTRFEAQALRESRGWDNANRELIFYYANHARKPAEALKIAELEIARRQDVYTLDAYAWALHANARSGEAKRQMDRVLGVGLKDPEVLARAAIIGSATTNR